TSLTNVLASCTHCLMRSMRTFVTFQPFHFGSASSSKERNKLEHLCGRTFPCNRSSATHWPPAYFFISSRITKSDGAFCVKNENSRLLSEKRKSANFQISYRDRFASASSKPTSAVLRTLWSSATPMPMLRRSQAVE